MITSILEEDLDWQPSYGGRTTKEIMTHIAILMEGDTKMGNGLLSTQEKAQNFEQSNQPRSLETILSHFDSSLKYVTGFYDKFNEAEMVEKKVKFFYQEESQTYTYLLVEVIEHLSLHKGILYSYMRQMGYSAGMTTYYGMAPAIKE